MSNDAQSRAPPRASAVSSNAKDDVLRLRDENDGLKRAGVVKDVALRRLSTKLTLIESTIRRAHDGTAAQVESAAALHNLQDSVDSLTRRNRHLAEKLRQKEELQRQRDELRATAIGRNRGNGASARRSHSPRYDSRRCTISRKLGAKVFFPAR